MGGSAAHFAPFSICDIPSPHARREWKKSGSLVAPSSGHLRAPDPHAYQGREQCYQQC